jgi:hypothetical protein
MFAVVEQKQHPLVLEAVDQAGQRILGADPEAEHGGNGARHQTRVAERRQIDEPDAVFVAGITRSAMASATVVLPMPPGPTIVTMRWRDSRATSVATTSSRPISRVTASGRLLAPADAAGGSNGAGDGASRLTGATKL